MCFRHSMTLVVRRSVQTRLCPWSLRPNPAGPNCWRGAANLATGSVGGLRRLPLPPPPSARTRKARAPLTCCTLRPSQQPPLRVRHWSKIIMLVKVIGQHYYQTLTFVLWINPQMHTGHLRVRSISYLPKCSIIHQASFSWAPLHQACRHFLVRTSPSIFNMRRSILVPHKCISALVTQSPSYNVNCLALDNVKVQYMQFMGYMKTPQYRTNLQQALEQEKVNLSLRIYILTL